MTKCRGYDDHFNLVLWVVLLSSSPSILAKGESVSLVFVGDIALDGAFYYQEKHGYCSFNQTFQLVAPHLQSSDLTIGNLEAPFITKDMEKNEQKRFYPRLRSRPASVYSLKYAGFDIMGLNNNHLTDFKERPINFTISLLNKIGIKTFGYTLGPINENRPQVPLIVEVKGIRIGFLGYCDLFKLKESGDFLYTCIDRLAENTAGPAIYTDENASRDVTALKSKVDVVVVSMHWGKEYDKNMTESQLQHYVHLTSLGVHLIIGCHPHVLQAHTASKTSFTAFSIGNFIFGPHGFNPGKFYYGRDPPKKVFNSFMKYVNNHPKSEDTLESRMLRVHVNKKGFVSAQYLPLRIGFDPRFPQFKCFRPQPLKQARWIDACSTKDKQCFKFQRKERKIN